jgi:cyanophycinase-like exopeptidase
MEKNIFLIGGGEIAKGETREIDEAIMKSANKGSSFVFFGTAAGDAEGYGDIISETFGVCFDIAVATEAKGREFSESAIKNASVIYLGGGTTKLLMDHFEKWNLVPLLRDAIGRGVIVAGMSAGAQALAEWYIHEEGELQEIRKGWDLIGNSVGVLVHATEDSFNRAKNIFSNSEYTNSKLYGISEGAALSFGANSSDFFKIGTGKILT